MRQARVSALNARALLKLARRTRPKSAEAFEIAVVIERPVGDATVAVGRALSVRALIDWNGIPPKAASQAWSATLKFNRRYLQLERSAPTVALPEKKFSRYFSWTLKAKAQVRQTCVSITVPGKVTTLKVRIPSLKVAK